MNNPYQVVAVANGKAIPIRRQSDDPAMARAIAWECYTYDQATGNPEADDYRVQRSDHIAYSADQDGRPAQCLCVRCHNNLVACDGARCDACRIAPPRWRERKRG